MVLKRIMFSLLGAKRYLRIVSSVFLVLYRTGLLRKRFPEHYFIRKLVHEGDHVLDIGANLGYYSIPLSRLCGKNGRVYAVEPVKMFIDILEKNTRFSPHRNISLLHCALGNENGKTIRMGTPVQKGVLRHGLTRVITEGDREAYSLTYEIIQYLPGNLFRDIPALHYVKCDVEGYEKYIIPEFRSLIQVHRPVFQIEIGDRESRGILLDFFREIDYLPFCLGRNRLDDYASSSGGDKGDVYFIPCESKDRWAHLLSGA